MKIAFYCRVDGQGFGFVLPDEAKKLTSSASFSPSIRIFRLVFSFLHCVPLLSTT